MWVAFLVALVMNPGSDQIAIQAAPQPFHTEAECRKANAQVEEMLKQSKEVKGYVLKCVEITKDDIKVNGKEV